jgi:hypothetical protein
MTTMTAKTRIYEGKTTRVDLRGSRPTRLFKLEKRCSFKTAKGETRAFFRCDSSGKT